MNGPEVTFTVHPRPASDDPRLIAAAAPAPPPEERASASRAIEDAAKHRDTFFGDLVFLARFAFGRL